jgi:peptide/nickel transport system permease protein
MTRAALVLLIGIHAGVLLAPWLAPYDPGAHNRMRPYEAPSVVRLLPRPAVVAGGRVYPLRFFTGGRLFGVEEPARIFLMGSDAFGRDQFSRLLYGGRISLAAGLLATVITLLVGCLVGAVSGFLGGWTDAALMRLTELFLALPWLYLLLAVRAFLPLHLDPAHAFLLVVLVVGLVGWARPARLVRGVVLSVRERGYVTAARAFGAGGAYLLRRHILPETTSVILTQATLLAPRYILAEVTLSFLGLGVGEPVPSWGNMLVCLQQYSVVVSYWWMLLPAMAMVPVFVGYFAIANRLLAIRKSGTL